MMDLTWKMAERTTGESGMKEYRVVVMKAWKMMAQTRTVLTMETTTMMRETMTMMREMMMMTVMREMTTMMMTTMPCQPEPQRKTLKIHRQKKSSK